MEEENNVEVVYKGRNLILGFGRINYGQRCRVLDEGIETVMDGKDTKAKLYYGKLERALIYASLRKITDGENTFEYPRESRKNGIPQNFIDELETDEVDKVVGVVSKLNPLEQILSGALTSGG